MPKKFCTHTKRHSAHHHQNKAGEGESKVGKAVKYTLSFRKRIMRSCIVILCNFKAKILLLYTHLCVQYKVDMCMTCLFTCKTYVWLKKQ